jgi:hypothetical protein
MEEDMTRALAFTLVPALLVSTMIAATPAAAEPAQRAVAACRAELLSRLPDARNYRVADISGNSRRTRVKISVTADQRYTFECAAGADGRVISATFDPPRGETRQAAAGNR